MMWSMADAGTKLQRLRDRVKMIHPVAWALVAGLFIASAIVSFALFTYSGIYVGDSGSIANPNAQPSPSPSGPPPPPVYTFALLGYGGAGHDGGRLTDSIMVIKIDTGLKKIGLISVPRDSWVSFPSSGWDDERHWKVNAAYAIGSDDRSYPNKPEQFTGEAGGGNLARYSLEKIVGFPVDHFVALDFTGFRKAIDVLGGVDVFVERSFEDPFYPIPGEEDNVCEKSEEDIAALTATLSAAKVEQEFTCRYEVLSFTRGTVHMDGETALKFVRSRHSPTDGGDFNRARRQRNLLLAVKDRVLSIGFIPKIIPFVTSLTYNLQTNVSVSEMTNYLDQRDAFLEYEIMGIPLTSDEDNALTITTSADGQSIVAPKTGIDDWQSVHEYIQQQLEGVEEEAEEASGSGATTTLDE